MLAKGERSTLESVFRWNGMRAISFSRDPMRSRGLRTMCGRLWCGESKLKMESSSFGRDNNVWWRFFA